MNYIYTAVFSANEDGTKIYARVPDLPGCVTTGRSLADAIDQITDAASGWLVVAEDEGLPIPAATAQNELAHEGAELSMIRVDTIAYRARTDPFYSEENMAHLKRIISDIDAGRARLTEHDLIEE